MLKAYKHVMVEGMQFNKFSNVDSPYNNLATATRNSSSLIIRNERVDDPEAYVENILGFAGVNDYTESKTFFCLDLD
jgi:hypothetical protein